MKRPITNDFYSIFMIKFWDLKCAKQHKNMHISPISNNIPLCASLFPPPFLSCDIVVCIYWLTPLLDEAHQHNICFQLKRPKLSIDRVTVCRKLQIEIPCIPQMPSNQCLDEKSLTLFASKIETDKIVCIEVKFDGLIIYY